MKLVFLILVALGIIFYFKSPGLFLAQAKSATNSGSLSKQAIVASGDVLGIAITMAKNTFNQLLPPQTIEKFASQTAVRIINNVQTDVNSAVSQTVNNILVNQLILKFKSLPLPVQKQVRENICK